MHETIGDHPLWRIPFLPGSLSTVHADTVLITWLAMAIVLVTLGALARLHPVTQLTKRYTVLELIVSALSNQVETILGRNGVPFVPFIISLFLFIFVMNEIGVIPFVGKSPTADLNTTAALALFAIGLVWGVGIYRKGLGYFGHLVIRPLGLGIPMLPIMIIDELARPVTLAMRLLVVAAVIAAHLGALSVAATGLPILVFAFNLIIGAIQALVFTLLTIAYLIAPTSDEH
jgi:F-type H+-transporting ATPase subunit a